MNGEALGLLLRSQRLRAFIGRPLGGDWEYVLWHGDDRRSVR
jgi:hypothetical protein